MDETTSASMGDDELAHVFSERLVSVGGHGHVVADTAAAARLIVSMAGERGTNEVVAAAELTGAQPALRESIERAGVSWRVPERAEEARDAPLGLSLGQLAVAETGSVLLAEATLADRAIGLVSATQVVICPRSALVPSLDDAAPVLRALSGQGVYATLVTGPSRTADIERQLTIGVQGPGEFHVILFEEESAS